ncbi:MAG: glyoxylate reductase [Peptococcaceae bacterium]|jgi:phosphoglycerate dehydrogenase-like enzyme|nr:glyoxylate reductase [Peptococcaceae bacterium]
MASKVIYFDKVFPAFKELLQSHNAEGLELLYWYEMNEAEKEASLKEADYFLVATTKITKDMLNKAAKVRMVQKTGIGVDNIDLQAAFDLGIPVCNTPGGNATGVAELTIGMILSLYRKLNVLDRATKNGEWLMWELRPSSYEMSGKTHGFIGFGNIGKTTAKLSQAFGTNVIYYDKYRLPESEEKTLGVTYMEMDEVLKNADIISLHIPLLPETRNLISTRELSLMKPTAILINVSRGHIVDEKALAQALENNVIAGAGFDTFASEPVEKDNPLLKFDNVLATPHIGAGTRDTLNKVLGLAFQNFSLIEKGENPKFVVNKVEKARL